MKCSNCQAELPAGAKFCQECGTKVAVPTQPGVTQNVGSVAPGGTVLGTLIAEGGDVHFGGQQHYGDQIAGDKVMGDKVTGDKIGGDKITVGDISGSTGLAIGRGAQASVTQGISAAELEKLFTPLLAAVHQAPPEKQVEAQQKAEALKTELAKGDQADDSVVGKLVDGLVSLVPGAVEAVVSLFATPVLGGVAGPVTKFVLDKIQGK
jgi:hypothetical protein